MVLDACVLYPFSLRDTLLRLAERELYDAFWSGRILEEMAGNLVADGLMPPAGAHRLAQAMRAAFEEAEVPAAAVDQLEPAMANHPKDRHVLAAAVAAHAGVIVTANLKDFPRQACAPLGVEAVHPDDFLRGLLAQAPGTVVAALREQAGDLHNPPVTLDELLQMLAKVTPAFVTDVRAHL